ncbi:uncharacterized protein LODBEIA_P55030 [Lodderomyces beijingensis]|uniref:Myb-like domain-containing protein n=1 Tax=Lodderomyces beijingensis TaxID=1775926 RepID=A0ABP0ZT15_9ASCO
MNLNHQYANEEEFDDTYVESPVKSSQTTNPGGFAKFRTSTAGNNDKTTKTSNSNDTEEQLKQTERLIERQKPRYKISKEARGLEESPPNLRFDTRMYQDVGNNSSPLRNKSTSKRENILADIVSKTGNEPIGTAATTVDANRGRSNAQSKQNLDTQQGSFPPPPHTFSRRLSSFLKKVDEPEDHVTRALSDTAERATTKESGNRHVSPSHAVQETQETLPKPLKRKFSNFNLDAPAKEASADHEENTAKKSKPSILDRVNDTLESLNNRESPNKVSQRIDDRVRKEPEPEPEIDPELEIKVPVLSTQFSEDSSEPDFVVGRVENAGAPKEAIVEEEISHNSLAKSTPLDAGRIADFDLKALSSPPPAPLSSSFSSWWSSSQWSKLEKVVRSHSIQREEAINSKLLMKELGCASKKELRHRYDFLLHYSGNGSSSRAKRLR